MNEEGLAEDERATTRPHNQMTLKSKNVNG